MSLTRKSGTFYLMERIMSGQIYLSLLDTELAEKLASLRKTTVDRLISDILREEAAAELAGWRIKNQKQKNKKIDTVEAVR
jgi:hypothetical protein